MRAMGYTLSAKEEQKLVDEKTMNTKRIQRIEKRIERLEEQKQDLEFRNSRIQNTILNSY